MKPLIKWPGGKSSELDELLPLVPEFDRYIEPFVGGGALYFRLEPSCAVINDISEDLMLFYGLLREEDPEMKRMLLLYSDTFRALMDGCRVRREDLLLLFSFYEKMEAAGANALALKPHLYLTEQIACAGEVMSELIADRDEYLRIMSDSVEKKFIRTVKNHRKRPFSEDDLAENLLTGFTGGYYLYFRHVFNEIGARDMVPSRAYRAANFYFVREYCYGSMFRYNRDGAFNIPYGGISYNRKDFRAKVERMYEGDVPALLRRTTLCCEDFEALMDHLDLTERDFIFLDPPYDTEFSDYEGKDFAREDHIRLAALLERTRAKFLLIIKNTEFISSLYEGKFHILHFDNRYSYNVRSRNDREAEHLLITNIDPEQGTSDAIRQDNS